MLEKELYSKVCVAKNIVDNAKEESINLKEYKNFSYNLAIILARDRKVVAVRLIHHANKCNIYLVKNSLWISIDVEYINEIEKYLKSLSKNTPIKLDDALEREDVRNLFERIMEYYSTKIDSRFEKLKGDIKNNIINNKQDPHIRSFMNYAKINAKNNINKADGYDLSPVCSNYYKKFNNSSASEKFLRHIKKMGSYYMSLINITAVLVRLDTNSNLLIYMYVVLIWLLIINPYFCGKILFKGIFLITNSMKNFRGDV